LGRRPPEGVLKALPFAGIVLGEKRWKRGIFNLGGKKKKIPPGTTEKGLTPQIGPTSPVLSCSEKAPETAPKGFPPRGSKKKGGNPKI